MNFSEVETFTIEGDEYEVSNRHGKEYRVVIFDNGIAYAYDKEKHYYHPFLPPDIGQYTESESHESTHVKRTEEELYRNRDVAIYVGDNSDISRITGVTDYLIDGLLWKYEKTVESYKYDEQYVLLSNPDRDERLFSLMEFVQEISDGNIIRLWPLIGTKSR